MFITQLYKVLSFILLPIGAYIALSCFFAIFFALSNPLLLLFLFIVACSAIYIFASFIFVYKGLIKAKQCKASLKDWIKINGFISVIFSLLLVAIFITLINHPEIFKMLTTQINTMQKSFDPKAPDFTVKKLMQSAYAGIIFGATLLLHITFSFTFIKTKSNLFEEE